jgi:hypothetical protein
MRLTLLRNGLRSHQLVWGILKTKPLGLPECFGW